MLVNTKARIILIRTLLFCANVDFTQFNMLNQLQFVLNYIRIY